MSLFTMLLLAAAGAWLLFGLRSHAVVNTGLTEAGLRAEFFERYDAKKAHWEDLCTRIASTTQSEKYRFLGAVPQMREWGTGRLAKGLNFESYDVENLEYEATIEVDRKEIEDDQTGQIRIRTLELADASKTFRDYLVEQLLINGETAGFNSYDGHAFFSTTHESGQSGAQSNKLTYSASDADNPTATEFRGALGQAIQYLVAYKDDRGFPRRAEPTGLVCAVPPSMMITALNAIQQRLVGTGAEPLQENVLQEAARVIALPGLTDASKFYVLKTDVPVRPFIFQDRMPIEFQAVAENSEESFRRGKFLYGVRARFRITYGYWQYAIRTDFT